MEPKRVRIEDIPAVVAEWRKRRGLPDRTPPAGLNKFERIAWSLQCNLDEIKRQRRLLAALRARIARDG